MHNSLLTDLVHGVKVESKGDRKHGGILWDHSDALSHLLDRQLRNVDPIDFN